MNTILFSILGIILLVSISWTFNSWGFARNEKAMRKLAQLRNKFIVKSAWLPYEENTIDPSIFLRPAKRTKLMSVKEKDPVL